MSLTIQQQKDYIKNYFHQYMDINLNLSFESNTKVNVIIPFSELYSETSAYNILSEYPNTSIPKEKEAYCTYVTDGDTIWVKDVLSRDSDNNVTLGEAYKVRFVGIDTPEVGESKADLATDFVKQCCFKKFIHLNIDSKKEKDSWGRTLAVVIVKNKNLNEILLREQLAKVDYIPPSEFNPSDWNIGTRETLFENEITNDLSDLSLFLNEELTNVVFTPKDDYETIYQYEAYKGVFYIKANPYAQNIRMHVLPRNYDCSDTVLFLKESMTDKLTIKKHQKYNIYENKGINAYFQVNGVDRDRNNPNISGETYNKSLWGGDETDVFVEYSYDVSKDTRSFEDIEICVAYKYNKTSPFYAIHYTGAKDNTNYNKDDRCTMIDVNVDRINSKSNAISQMAYSSNNTPGVDDDKVYIKHDVKNNIKKEFGQVDHVSDINDVHYKKIKYINDLIYVEEDGIYSGKCEWIDPTS